MVIHCTGYLKFHAICYLQYSDRVTLVLHLPSSPGARCGLRVARPKSKNEFKKTRYKDSTNAFLSDFLRQGHEEAKGTRCKL
jgi:hypothetical protein